MGEDVVAAHPLPSTLFLRSSPRDRPPTSRPPRCSLVVPTKTSRWSVGAPECVESDRECVDLFERRDDSKPSPSSPSLEPPGVDRGVSPPLPGVPSPSPPCSGVCCVRGEGIGGALYPAGL